MSKTTAINTAATSERELTEAELEHVSGGKGTPKLPVRLLHKGKSNFN